MWNIALRLILIRNICILMLSQYSIQYLYLDAVSSVTLDCSSTCRALCTTARRVILPSKIQTKIGIKEAHSGEGRSATQSKCRGNFSFSTPKRSPPPALNGVDKENQYAITSNKQNNSALFWIRGRRLCISETCLVCWTCGAIKKIPRMLTSYEVYTLPQRGKRQILLTDWKPFVEVNLSDFGEGTHRKEQEIPST